MLKVWPWARGCNLFDPITLNLFSLWLDLARLKNQFWLKFLWLICKTFQIMAWITLHDEIFSDIMIMVGLYSLEGLHRCRQVCTKWNEKILRDIWGSQSKKKIMKERIERSWGPGMFPSDEEISHAKWLGKCSWSVKFIKNIILLWFQKLEPSSTLIRLRGSQKKSEMLFCLNMEEKMDI